MIQPGRRARERERYGELREVVGYGIGGMGNTQNDLFIRSGICTGHELKNDGHLDKFPFVRFYYPHQMQIYDRTRKFTPRPVRESIFFVVFFWLALFTYSPVRRSVFQTLSHFEPVAKLHKFFMCYDFPFIHSFRCFFLYICEELERWGAKCFLVFLLGLAFELICKRYIVNVCKMDRYDTNKKTEEFSLRMTTATTTTIHFFIYGYPRNVAFVRSQWGTFAFHVYVLRCVVWLRIRIYNLCCLCLFLFVVLSARLSHAARALAHFLR